MKKAVSLVFISLLFLFIGSTTSYAKKGLWLGFDANYGPVSVDFTDSSGALYKNKRWGLNWFELQR